MSVTDTLAGRLPSRIGFTWWHDRLFACLALSLALGCLVLSLASFGLTFQQPYAGLTVHLEQNGAWVVERVDAAGAAALDGLKNGDRIVSLDGQDIGQVAKQRVRFSIGSAERLVVVRDGAELESELLLRKDTPASIWDPLVLLALSLSFLVTGLAAVVVQGRDPVVRTFFFLCIAAGAGTGVAVGADRGLIWMASVGPPLYVLSSVLLGHFFLLYPVHRHARLFSIPLIPWGLYVPTVAVLVFCTPAYSVMPDWQPVASVIVRLAIVAGFATAVASLVKGFKVLSPWEARHVKVVLIGTLVSFSPFVLLTVVPLIYSGEGILRPLTSIGFFMFMPLSFAYGILRHKLLGIDLLLVRRLIYGIIIAALLAVYIVIIMGTHWLVIVPHEVGGYGFIELALMIGAVLTFGSVRGRIQSWVDRVVYKDYYDYRETLLSLSASMASVQQPERLSMTFVTGVGQIMGLTWAVLYLGGSRKSFVLAASWPALALPAGSADLEGEPSVPNGVPARVELRDDGGLLVPLVCRGEPLGVLVLGPKRSGVGFRSVDVDLLSTLASNAAIAIDNARLFAEVGKAEAVREMARLKNEFVDMVSHELRSPLTPIIGYAELLCHSDRPMDPHVQQYADVIYGAARRMQRLVDDLLDVSRLERAEFRLERRDVDLSALVEGTARGFALGAQQHVLLVHTPNKPIMVHVDPERIRQVLTNLLNNSLRYSPRGGTIEVNVIEDETHACMSVMDQGVGIPMKDLDHVFDKFYRVQSALTSKVQGTGLGLAICRSIMEAHDGKIWVESEVGKGSIFFVTVPLLNPS